MSVSAALAIAGCGDDDDETHPAARGATHSSAGGSRTVERQRDRVRAQPRPTRPCKPGTVSFKVTNDGSVDHNLEVEGPSGEQELEQDLGPGESGTLTVDLSKPGNYEFYCPVDDHRDLRHGGRDHGRGRRRRGRPTRRSGRGRASSAATVVAGAVRRRRRTVTKRAMVRSRPASARSRRWSD